MCDNEVTFPPRQAKRQRKNKGFCELTVQGFKSTGRLCDGGVTGGEQEREAKAGI